MRVRIQLLGPLRAWRDGDELDLGGPQQRAVLGLLAACAASGSVLSLADLIDAIWEDPPASGHNVIQTYLKRLRRLLEPDRPPHAPSRFLQRVAGGHTLRPSYVDLDLVAFRDLLSAADEAERAGDLPRAADLLGEAIRLWNGAPLANVPDIGNHPVIVAIAGERWAAVARYGEAMLATGEALEALPTLEHAAATCPLDEAAHARLIRVYHAIGNRAQAFATYHAIRARLAEELGVDPNPELVAAHHALLQDDPQPPATDSPTAGMPAPEKRSAPAGVDPTATDPAQLPVATAAFVGRTEQLRQLDKLLSAQRSTDAVTIATIVGTAGIGKTTLAVHWAHQVKDEFPDGQLFVNLRGFDPGGSPVTSAEAVRGFLDALQVPPQSIPASLDAQIGMYRSMLAGRRMLILLDNAGGTEQVWPLLPGAPGCLVLVTSRNQLTGLVAGSGAHTTGLDPLPASEAILMLSRRIGADRIAVEPATIDEIIVRCGGLPLALAIVAARVVTRPDFPLDAVARDLRGSGEDLDAFDGGEQAIDLRAVFSWSYRALAAPTARLFRLLALHPGPDISAPAAASLAGLPARQTRQALAELTRAHLIGEHVPGRFRFHDLIRAYATELADRADSPQQRHTATLRLLDHYLHAAGSAAVLLWERHDATVGGPIAAGVTPEELAGLDQARAWFMTEYPVLLRAIALAERSGFDHHLCRLVWSVAMFLERRGLGKQLIAVQSAALAAAQRLADPPLIARAYRAVGVAKAYLGRYEEARDYSQRALKAFEELADVIGQAHTHNNLAWLSSQGRDDHHASIVHKQRALELFRAAGDQAEVAGTLGSIGWTHTQLGDYREALAYCEEALALLSQLGKRHEQAVVLDTLGLIHHRLMDHQAARRLYERALRLFRQLGDRTGEAETLTNLGDTHHAASNVGEARAAWSTALSILDDIGHADADRVRAKLSGSAT